MIRKPVAFAAGFCYDGFAALRIGGTLMMKKSRVTAACMLLSVFLAACGSGSTESGKEAETTPVQEKEEDTAVSGNTYSAISENKSNIAAGEELFAVVSSEEDAQAIADQYGIELVTFAQGVATYHTEEDPGTVVRRGRENGWPPIAVNQKKELID